MGVGALDQARDSFAQRSQAIGRHILACPPGPAFRPEPIGAVIARLEARLQAMRPRGE
ncbi:MAG: hypothetical protein QHC40_01385 [Sphingobium sp.]|nr:hypothetical protein [Sphingobium sp.]